MMCPSIFTLTSTHFFPVDIVYATIEIKTTLDSKEAKQAIDNVKSVRDLDFISQEFSTIESHRGGGTQHVLCRATPPIGVVFSYSSTPKSFKTFKQWFVPKNPDDKNIYPSLIAHLDQGLLIYDKMTSYI